MGGDILLARDLGEPDVDQWECKMGRGWWAGFDLGLIVGL